MCDTETVMFYYAVLNAFVCVHNFLRHSLN